MIKEIIVVEGKDDISAIKAAVDAEVIATNGFGFPRGIEERIKKAAKERGIIVLTDPDYAGEKIRKRISTLVPNCKHAFVPQTSATKNDDIGVENATPEAIILALSLARYETVETSNEYSIDDMIKYNFIMCKNAKNNRIKVGEKLGIGYGNAKQFLNRLNNYGVRRSELEAVISKCED